MTIRFEKPILWILDQDINQQMVINEILSEKFDLYFFDDVSCLRNYQNHSCQRPTLLIYNLQSASAQLENFLLDNPSIETLALAPYGTTQNIIERMKIYTRTTLEYPYSKERVIDTIDYLCAPWFTQYEQPKYKYTSAETGLRLI